jgi:arabinofuranan 3-O-arabinosyltransferase
LPGQGSDRPIAAGARAAIRRRLDVAVLALVAIVPFLLSSPGRLSSDTNQALYVDPGGLLARAGYLWDPSVGTGTVTHQQIGLLWPMGPWFWLVERLGIPMWVGQRLWLGGISLAAGLGVRWLLRQLGLHPTGALVAALVYQMAPYQLAFTARISALLLPWAGLGWIVGLAHRSVRRRGWRDAAACALVVLAVGTVNGSSLAFVAVAPAVWVAADLGRHGLRRVAATVGQVSLLSLLVSGWWLVALQVEGQHGLPLLRLTENLRTTTTDSSPLEVLRGLGNWFFYGADRLGTTVVQAPAYYHDASTRFGTFALPALALVAALLVRWRWSGRFVALVAAGTVVAVGAWPFDDPSPYGRAVRHASDTAMGLALRNSARAVPVVLLGLAALLGAAVAAVPGRSRRALAAAAVVGVAVLAVEPVLSDGLLSRGITRPEELPSYVQAAARGLDADGAAAGTAATRALELPGAPFASYRWGHTIDSILPILADRGVVQREILPQGSPSAALLVDALDRALLEGRLDPRALPRVARLLGVGTVVLRNDLRTERYGGLAPDELADELGASPPELRRTAAYGTVDGRPAIEELAVEDPVPIVRTAPGTAPILLAGDADGLVDAAAAGLVDGRALVLPAATLPDRAIADHLRAGDDVVVTDTYRQRIQTWFYAIRDVRGPTEVAGERQPEPTGYDYRLDASPDRGASWRTTVQQVGGRVAADRAGGASRPEDRAASAVDGDPGTAWRVGGADPQGARWSFTPSEPVAADRLVLVQPQDGPRDRVVTQVRVTVDGRSELVDLGPESLAPTGQAVALDGAVSGRIRSVSVEITGVSQPPFDPAMANAVGFAEIQLGGAKVVEEAVVPEAVLGRVGASGRRVDLLLTRLRTGPYVPGRHDEEAAIRRELRLGAPREFALAGTLRAAGPSPLAEGCQPLLLVDGQPVQVRPGAATADGRARDLVPCGEPLELSAGVHHVAAVPGEASGVDVDQLVLSSGADGRGTSAGPRGAARDSGAARVLQVERSSPVHLTAEIEDGREPFWFVLGESDSSGWEISVDGGAAGARTVVDGGANGWRIRPDGAGEVVVHLRWAPQRAVSAALGLSGGAAALCLALACWPRRRDPQDPDLLDAPSWQLLPGPEQHAGRSVAIRAGAVGLGALLVASPVAALVGAAVVVAAGRVRWIRPLMAAAVPAGFAWCVLGSHPGRAWLVLVAVVAAVVARPAADLTPRRAAAPGPQA